jgi:hypothetical protein
MPWRRFAKPAKQFSAFVDTKPQSNYALSDDHARSGPAHRDRPGDKTILIPFHGAPTGRLDILVRPLNQLCSDKNVQATMAANVAAHAAAPLGPRRLASFRKSQNGYSPSSYPAGKEWRKRRSPRPRKNSPERRRPIQSFRTFRPFHGAPGCYLRVCRTGFPLRGPDTLLVPSGPAGFLALSSSGELRGADRACCSGSSAGSRCGSRNGNSPPRC